MSLRHTLNNEVYDTKYKKGRWTKEEDDVLNQLVSLYGQKSWKKISDYMKCRSPIQCLHRWTKILQPGLIKGPWTNEEDRKLKEWVTKEGPNRWSSCAEYIKGRNGKQCRERWFNILNPTVKKGEWDIEEDYKIFFLFMKSGSKWSNITQYFTGRTENSIKNRFYSTLRRVYTEKKRKLFPYGNDKLTPTVSTTLEELLKYFDIAFNNIKIKFLKIKNFSLDQLKIYDNQLSGNKSESSIITVQKQCDQEVEISQDRTNHTPEHDEDLKFMDIFSLENQIADMCDNSSLFFNNEDHMHLDDFIENIFVNNNIVVNDDNCKLCEEPIIESKTIVDENKSKLLDSLFKQLNDIENAVQQTKQELLKMENKNIEPVCNLDYIFNF
jgi:hypothetical protein